MYRLMKGLEIFKKLVGTLQFSMLNHRAFSMKRCHVGSESFPLHPIPSCRRLWGYSTFLLHMTVHHSSCTHRWLLHDPVMNLGLRCFASPNEWCECSTCSLVACYNLRVFLIQLRLTQRFIHVENHMQWASLRHFIHFVSFCYWFHWFISHFIQFHVVFFSAICRVLCVQCQKYPQFSAPPCSMGLAHMKIWTKSFVCVRDWTPLGMLY